MGHELADAIRLALHRQVLATFGDLTRAAKAIGVPYKTLYRALNPHAKDSTDTVALDLILEVIERVHAERPDVTLTSIYEDARPLRAALVSDGDISLPSIEDDPELYGLAAKRGKKHTEEP